MGETQGKALPSPAPHLLKGLRPLRIPYLRPFYGLKGTFYAFLRSAIKDQITPAMANTEMHMNAVG